MAVDMPHRYIDLKGWEFICFVEHAEKSDIKIYDSKHQLTVDIMFLVRRSGLYRLMSYKTNPWHYSKDPTGQTDKGIFMPHDDKIILFSGIVNWPFNKEDKTMGKRLRKEKIRCCHLLT